MSELQPARDGLDVRSPVDPGAITEDRVLDGITLARHAAVQSPDEVADVLRAARDAGDVVIPWGGGTMMGLGNLPATADVALDLTALNQIVSYEPDDLTIAVQAGCRIGDINRLLGDHGQMLPFDAAAPDEATIGGIFCTAVSGPRRFGYGSMRDLVIGISTMSADGEISRGGGMVVKNVSGYDMMRLHYGALGSLGVVLQLNFKVLPAPRATRTVVLAATSLAEAVDAAMAVRESPLLPTAIVILDERSASAAGENSSPWTVLLRAEGPEQSVERQAERLIEAAGPRSAGQRVLANERSESVWRVVNECLSARPSDSICRIRIGVAPSGIDCVVTEIRSTAQKLELPVSIMADAGNGQVIATFGETGVDPSRLAAAWDTARGLGKHATLLTGPASVKANVDVFGAEPAGFRFTRALKQQFDPSGVLNRGRFIGRL